MININNIKNTMNKYKNLTKTLSLKNLSFQTFKCLLIKWNVTIISIISTVRIP